MSPNPIFIYLLPNIPKLQITMRKQASSLLLAVGMLTSALTFQLQAQPGVFGRGPSAPAGPPAPVPPEVMIARPTQSEVDQMNAALKKFIAAAPDKELLTKYEALLTVQVPR